MISFAKTVGKHVWDQNKTKIIKKGFEVLKNGRSNSTKSLLDMAEGTLT